ncbi:hypothetical protein VitviT2T_022988 [Vitis vinifera]|uniref:Uncharacterized protein n=1 Tax=Vitis vinifera TaxID=29760 RepID=A0ABY9DDE2_VITVI|nr:hypothetical protein VitviT2T_022988 [Vitis vinifera]
MMDDRMEMDEVGHGLMDMHGDGNSDRNKREEKWHVEYSYRESATFGKPPDVDDPQNFMATLLDRLKNSLALTLDHFYPHAGHLVTKKEDSSPSYMVFVGYNNSPGAQFIHAATDMTISGILSSIYIPQVLQSFFDHDRHFFNAWSEVFTAQEKNSSISLSHPPTLKCWFPNGYGPIIHCPFIHHDEFINRFEAPVLREKIFHFSSESIAKLKAKANA